METEKKLQIEVSEDMILQLLRSGQICAADLQCLNGESQQFLHRLCLKSCSVANRFRKSA